MTVLFSVIVPVYKVEKYLKHCVESILNQTFTDFELILVDDGSPDKCPMMCDEFAKKDSRVHVIHQENKGVVSARKAALFYSKGRYICHVDGDDWVKPELLAVLAECIEQQNEPDIILFDSERVFKDRVEKMPNYLKSGYYDKSRLAAEVYPHMIYDRSLPFLTSMITGQTWNKTFKRELLLEHYCKNERLYKLEDFAFVYECFYYAKSMYYCDSVLYCYNKMNEESAMSTYDESYFENLSAVIDYTRRNICGGGDALEDQVNAYAVSGVVIGIFHEMRHGMTIKNASAHIRRELKKTKILKNVSLKNIPSHAKVFVMLLRMHMYRTALLMAKLYLHISG
jgi:glycosyltransferase involved in cell wall biosynthesis